MEEANFREVTRVVREGVNLTLVGSKVEDRLYRPVKKILLGQDPDLKLLV